MSVDAGKRSRRLYQKISAGGRAGLPAAVVEMLEQRRLLSGISFAPPVTYTVVGSNVKVFPVETADLTGDGIPDIVAVNNNGTVSILLGNGDGTFKPAQTIPDGQTSTSSDQGGDTPLAIADLGNGHQDILVTNQYSGEVSVLLGNGDGTFQMPAQVLATGSSSVAEIAVADLGNGTADLVTANYDGTVSVLLGRGNGKFKSPQIISVGGSIRSLELADINGDGHIDIVLGNKGTGTAMVLPGNGNGTFGVPETISAAGTDVKAVHVADFNGHADLVIQNQDKTSDLLLVYLAIIKRT